MAKPIDVMVRRDSGTWGAWSPQCRGLAIVQPSATELRRALPGALRGFLRPEADLDVRTHVEHDVRGVVVRVAQDHQRWERQLTADRVVAALGDPRQAEEMVAQARNALGDVVFVCAMPGDTVDWIIRQMEEDGDAVNVVVPVADDLIWVSPFTCDGDGKPERFFDGIGVSETASLAEIMKAESAPRHMAA